MSRGQPQPCPQSHILLSVLFWELALWPPVHFRGCAGGKDTVWPACTPIPVTHAKSGLAKGLQAAGSVDVGELANTEGRKKDRTSLLPSSLSRRPLQNLTALIAGGSLPAFFHFLFQDVLLARLFHKKVNLYSASASSLICSLSQP